MKLAAFSQLKARGRAIGQIYFSLIEAKFQCSHLSILRQLGTPSDRLVEPEYMRLLEREGELIIGINNYYESLLEILTSVELSFKRTSELTQQVDEIEHLNESVNDHVDSRIDQFEERIRNELRSLPREITINFLEPRHAQVISTYNAQAASSITDPIMNEMYREMRDYINSHIEWPIDHFLTYLEREIRGEENEALQAWRVQVSP